MSIFGERPDLPEGGDEIASVKGLLAFPEVCGMSGSDP